MKDKYTMGAHELESINGELFDSFDPEQELWIIGGSTTHTVSTTTTYSSGNTDFDADYEWT
jgi:hypothetical protein